MTFKEFGTVVESAKSPGQYQEFGEVVEPMSRTRSLVNAPLKGATKRFGDITGFVQDIAPSFIPRGPLTREKVHEFAEKNLPTFEKEPEKILERAGGVGLESLLTPGGPAVKAVQTGVGTGLGYAAEKLGLPDWAQSIAESLPFFYSGGKKIPLKKDQLKLGEFLRKQGLTENEITPLLKTPEQINRWSTYAKKGKKSRELMESIYNKTGHIYDSVISEGKKLPPLSEESKMKILNQFAKIAEEMPNKYRDLIRPDMKDFISKGRAGAEDLINLDKDINSVLGSERGARDIIGRFKEPIKEALNSIDPKIAEDYSLAKEFYKGRHKVKGALLNPKEIESLMDLGEAYGLGHGIYNRDMGTIAKVLGVTGARHVAREMLINPRLQNKAVRIGEALRNNKYLLSEKYMREFADILREENPETADEIDALLEKR